MTQKILSLIIILTLLAATGCTNIQPDGAQKPDINLYPASQQLNTQTLWGYIDETGKFIIPPTWELAESFAPEGLAIVTQKDLVGLINTKGDVITPIKYASIMAFSEGMAVATIDYQQYDVIDTTGQVLYSRTGINGYYKEGLIGVQNPDALFGYADKTGKDIIAPQYTETGEFVQGKALVRAREGAYLLIDPNGTTLKEFSYDSMWSVGEGLYAHGIPNSEGTFRYGYVDSENNIILEADLDEVGEFHNGLAVVGRWGGEGPERGLVNKKGEFVVPMEYGAIVYLGGDLYGVIKKSMMDNYQGALYQKAAIMDSTGKLLTEERFYNLTWFDKGLLSASDGVNTFLIDRSGALAVPGITSVGVGMLTKQGSLIRADADNVTRYYTADGKELWHQERTRVYPAVTIKIHSKRFDRYTYIEYPVITGLKNPPAADKINQALETVMLKPYMGITADSEYPTDTSLVFTERILGNLLEIQAEGYQYPLGAAHGTGWIDTYYFDLGTGDRYQLHELFYPDSGYDVTLSQLIKELIPLGDMAEIVDPEMIEPIPGDHAFRLQEGGLEIYYQVYELAAYAAGQPSFTIPWSRLDEIIDKKGALWKAYKN